MGEQQRITPRVYFSLLIIFMALYSIYIGTTIYSNGTTQQPSKKLPSKYMFLLTNIIVGICEILIGLFGIIAFSVRGKYFLILLLVGVIISTFLLFIITSFYGITSIRFDYLDTMGSDNMITIEYENNCCGWKTLKLYGCGSPIDSQETCYSLTGVGYEKLLKSTFSNLLFQLLFFVFYLIEVIDELNQLRNKQKEDDMYAEPFIDPDNE
ncbi:hypothetical protein EDI_032730 [Entamoeba dispar SAW760]|uniref:Tetraspanin family protein n=1 Tax=Entamoeba dispar (strain ATCC PRA-260 / SAW760) TaxID=370354 RepID=B0E8E3_ENTDS|nr:uncharacterized protein EDI_032730 [Entamoeba dispar SAW760]EDR29186.1 hypothetical protein EDI_032730 [Entamoeba dispar SAW760]|eukprot:EDR29186.1 hypothetical protein EDI_032730 [Entamoeba dispar SAW760]